MDLLAQVNNQLLAISKPKSQLAPYFQAHLLFQRVYRTPSPTPSPPPSSPRLGSSAQSQILLHQPLRSCSMKRRRLSGDEGDEGDEGDMKAALPKRTRLSYAHKCSIQPCTPTAMAMPSPSTRPASPHPSSLRASTEEHSTYISRAKEHALQQLSSIIVGRYTLRRTAARARQKGGQGSAYN